MKMPEVGFGVVPIEQVRGMDGLTLFDEIRAGRLPAPPLAKVLGFWIDEVEAGRVVFAYEPVIDHYNPIGSVHGGIAATLLDSVMGCSVHTQLKAGVGYTTVEIKINYVRAMTDKTGRVRAEGKVINLGSRIATAEGRLTDAAGKLLAHGTTTCLLFPI
ncbi:MAG: PaaI family thioesterase [Alphaproteobacteria bacterium]|nr:PaaI family thioesterase [Alphaproteobacteria bacterium]